MNINNHLFSCSYFILFINCVFSLNSYLYMRSKSLHTFTPKTPNQIIYNNILKKEEDYLLSVIGPAGTGKTFLACLQAIEQFKDKKIDKIVITRPLISVEEENIGFLPGNLEKKMDPWVRPIYDVFLDYYSRKEINELILNNKIEISPLGFMRGRTFKNSFIIADEMQNSTPNQMLMLLTRIGINSKIVITGDLNQSDLGYNNGLRDLIEKLEKKTPDNFYLLKLNEMDIQRSKLVTDVLNIYKKEETLNVNVNRNTTVNSDASLIPVDEFYKKIYYKK